MVQAFALAPRGGQGRGLKKYGKGGPRNFVKGKAFSLENNTRALRKIHFSFNHEESTCVHT